MVGQVVNCTTLGSTIPIAVSETGPFVVFFLADEG